MSAAAAKLDLDQIAVRKRRQIVDALGFGIRRVPVFLCKCRCFLLETVAVVAYLCRVPVGMDLFGVIAHVSISVHLRQNHRFRPQLLDSSENRKILASIGAKKSPMHLAAEHTVIIDLTKSLDELLADMRRQTRYEVRRADKLDIKVESGNSPELFKEFHKAQSKTAQRQHFVPPDEKTLLAERDAFGKNARIYVAKTAEGKPIAYGLILIDGDEGEYYEAASTELNRKLPGAYALQWQVIKDLKKAGVKRYNLWGIAPANQPHHRYAGVTTFKTGFGGEVVAYTPAHDLVISHLRYAPDYIIEKVRKKRRHL